MNWHSQNLLFRAPKWLRTLTEKNPHCDFTVLWVLWFSSPFSELVLSDTDLLSEIQMRKEQQKKSIELHNFIVSIWIWPPPYPFPWFICTDRICKISRVDTLICKASDDHPSCYKFGLMKLLSCAFKEVESREKENPSPFFLICFPVIMLFGHRYERCGLGKPDIPVLWKDSADAVYHMVALSQHEKKGRVIECNVSCNQRHCLK